MTPIPYRLDPKVDDLAPIGLVVLQADETLEPELRRAFADVPNPIYVTRIPSSDSVTTETLSAMKSDLTQAASLLPNARPYPVIGYGCTSASAVIGSDQVEQLIQTSCDVTTVTNPLRAAVHVAQHHGVSKFAMLSPYLETVNAALRTAFADQGISTEVFGTFNEPNEARVVRIAKQSIVKAAVKLGQDPQTEAVFLSCTNLQTFDAIPEIEAILGKPVFSSNSALATHIKQLIAPKN